MSHPPREQTPEAVTLQAYLEEIARLPRLTQREEQALGARIQRGRPRRRGAVRRDSASRDSRFPSPAKSGTILDTMPCPICDDTRWKIVERGGVRRAARCECWRAANIERLIADARIPRRYQHCTLDNFVAYENERLQNAVVRARRFAEAFPVVDKGLFLIGPPGIGKSHLAVAVLEQVMTTRGARGLFYDVRDLLKIIRNTYDPVVKATEFEVLRPVMSAELLVLDDIGAEKTSEWVEETLNLIVTTRYNERRVTIFTSNYEEKEDRSDPDSLLSRVGFRMHSRLYEMCEFLEYDGADYRHRPPNAGSEDLLAMWKLQARPTGGLPRRSGAPVRAQLRKPDPKADVAWPGGRAGSGH